MSEYLVIDIGNSSAKLAIYERTERISEVEHLQTEELIDKVVSLKRNNKISSCMISSVTKETSSIIGKLRQNGISTNIIDSSLKMPFTISYTTPKSLGADRLSVVAGAVSQPNRGQNILIIDVGTAITYEFIEKNNYLGGCIAPGLTLRLKALNKFTSKLPLCNLDDFTSWIGESTHSAIAAGVINGCNFEIEGYINRFFKQYGADSTIFVTGGDYKYLSLTTKNAIFALPNLVLDGIAIIKQLNINE